MASGHYDGSMNKKQPRKILAVLLSCCIFLAIICACLIAALVMIGKHIMNNTRSSASGKTVQIHYPTRLPRDTNPILYDITLLPNLDEGEYKGILNVTLNITASRPDIRIHSSNLTIDLAELRRVADFQDMIVSNVEDLPLDEILVIHTKETIEPGIYFLYIKFSGSMQNKLQAFYRSYYKSKNNGTIRQMATSKFEPTYARQAFPCFDEPNMKAKFKVHLLKPKDPTYRALSNYPQNGEEEVENGILVHFEETVPMSTYLSCFIVSDFTYTETDFTSEDQTIPFRVYASPGQLEKTQYAGKVGKDAIEFYSKYFNLPYPLPKLDMVAIPDFVSGAMEHWGLVTYRETALLYSRKTHSSSNKQRVASVVAHELAHSWFGNLVTMDWWDNLWLNEGFATYIQYKGVNASEPDWQMLDQFLVADLHPVLDLDATIASHPIIKNVTTPDQITEVFDTISYSKGASILRMLENAVGGEAFRKGVTNYLNNYKYSNAVTQNLWDELQAVIGDSFNVTHFMDTYTEQMGYPLINVTIDDANEQMTLTQKWFLTNQDTASKAVPSPYGYRWTIPIRYITDVNSTESEVVWFSQDQDEVILPLPESIKWIKFNPKQVGYYRVNYNTPHWYSLIANVNEMTVADRTHLLEEMFGLAEAGIISYNMTLDLTKYLVDETEYLPWAVAGLKLDEISVHLTGSDKEWDFKKYVKTIVEPTYKKLSWNEDENDSHLKRLARYAVLKLACSVGHEQCLAEAKEKFEDWLHNNTVLSPDVRGLIYEYGMETIDERGWYKVLEIFANETDANEKLKLMNGLANVRDPALLSKLINLAKNESFVRKQDYFTCLKYIADNPLGTPVVWDYVRDEWLNLVKRFTLNDRYLGRLIATITATFSTQVKLEEIVAFCTKYPEAGAGAAAREQAIDNVKNNIKWLSKYKIVVEEWLGSNNFYII